MFNKIIYLILILLFFNPLFADKPSEPIYKWVIGEELVYSVKWTFIKLGELRLQVLGDDTLNGRHVYHCRIYMDSEPGLPFITLHDIYDSYIDAKDFYSHAFLAYEQKKDHLLYTQYVFDYKRSVIKVRVEKRLESSFQTILDSTVTIDKKIHDSLSMLYFARAMVKNKSNIDLTLFVYNNIENTYIKIAGESNDFEMNDKPIMGYFLEGKLKFVGIAGVKEDFKGYFSTDKQSVPLIAYMKAFIGSVKIQLEKWKKWDNEIKIFKKN
jgi:hypothetical protein